MDINYKFSNLIGSVYRQGQVTFSPDGNTVISPVGNKLSLFDLKNNVSRTLALETSYSIYSVAINVSGTHMALADQKGQVHYINMRSETVLYKYSSCRKIKSLQFSPNGRMLAVCRDNDLQLFELSLTENQMFHPFSLFRTYKLSSESLNCVEWSSDSSLLVAGGDDKLIRVVGSRDFRNLFVHPISAHKGEIVNCQFLKSSYDMITICKRGVANVWTSSHQIGDLEEGVWRRDNRETTEEEMSKKIFFEKTKKFSLSESSGSGKNVDITSCKLHANSNVLVTAFDNGVFVLHEIPSFSLIHNLRVSDLKITTVAINLSGDWLAIGCGKGSAAQLVVWEWQSETYVMKQQSHSLRVTSAKYSPDGSYIATGAEDGKVKIWNSKTSFCTVTFAEHTSSVTAVRWTQNGRAILSASLDGTVRAHDLKRYRNFRTLVCPEPTQLGCLAVDSAGDIVIAGGKEVFNIFVWSMDTGHLLDILSGHEANISAVDIHSNFIVSSSWDRTVKLWSIVNSQADTTELAHEAVDVCFSPGGDVVAVLTLDSTITFYESKEMAFIGSIEAHLDLDPSRGRFDTITRQNAVKSKSFTTIAFSPDGNLLLAGGESNNFCLYSVTDRLLMKKFTVTENRSLDGVALDVNRRNFTEFGNMELVDTSDEEEERGNKKAIQLPGTKNFDLGERRSHPEMSVFAVTYCPTGRRFAVCSTEGVGIYSLDVVSLFDPFQLDSRTNPDVVRRALEINDYSLALMASLKLADSQFICDSLESTSITQIPLVVKNLPLAYAERLLKWMSDGNIVSSTRHVHFYMIWLRALLQEHGMRLKGRADVATLTGVQQILAHHSQLISSMANQNKYSLTYFLNARKIKRPEEKKEKQEEEDDGESMPRVSKPEGAKWQNAEMSVDNFNDENFAFLASFEEILADNVEEDVPKKRKQIKKKPPKEDFEASGSKFSTEETDQPEVDVEEKRRLKKERRKKQMALNKLKKKERLAKRKTKEQNSQTKSSDDSSEVDQEKKKEENKGKKRKAGESGAVEPKIPKVENSVKKTPKETDEENGKLAVSPDSVAFDVSAWKNFHCLPSEILDAIVDLKFSEPTEIQSSVLPSAVRDRMDILGAAETGSGKTLAFGIPAICRLLEQDEKAQGPRVLMIAPTRELCIQIMSHVKALIKFTKFTAQCIVGGLAQPKQERLIKTRPPEIIVATPGRLWSMLENAAPGSYFANLKDLRCLVVDETDRMVEEGHFEELTHILNKIHEEAETEKLQTLVFSATLTFAQTQSNKKQLTPEQKIQRLIELTGLREGNRKIVDLTRQLGTAGCLVETRINCSDLLDKDTSLMYLLSRYSGRTLVFVNSVDAARRLHGILSALRRNPLLLHAKMLQRQRLRNLERFTAEPNSVLLATDVAARGLDIKGIDHVIHYQVPKAAETYIHRSGRTARARNRGLTILLVDPPSRNHYTRLCRNLNRMEDLDIFPIDNEPLMETLRRRVKLASELDKLTFRCKKIRLNESWFEKTAREAGLEYDETRNRELEGANEEVDQMKNKERQIRNELGIELERPLPRQNGSDYLKTRYITPDIVSKLNATKESAIDLFHEKKAEAKEWKKRNRKAIKTVDIKIKPEKKRK
ncbi:unnamed protein product [Caenorhabditis auriculariae]|uniref:RNA helicase n=1 Tax=Caenorhabditis auriculariae TaxID=2777116 RepID=A0A8S1GYR9_9PELO|nr:unnamed protein product [Caenorhabditis auriculariae]